MNHCFQLDDVVQLAKRENNAKRSYLYVNPLQGKHVPASPSKSLELFSLLAELVEKKYGDERVLLVGFAETATAIGNAIAFLAKNVKYFMTTTREVIDGAEYLFFTESHSHATEQRLVCNGLYPVLKEIDRILFAEDEVTTGNTIEKLVRTIQTAFPEYAGKFGIVSILNSIASERMTELAARDIPCDYLFKLPENYLTENDVDYVCEPLLKNCCTSNGQKVKEIRQNSQWDFRQVSPAERMRNECADFAEQFSRSIAPLSDDTSLLILGTEEFMFPAMLLGEYIEKEHPKVRVRFHATTRSPIEVCKQPGYPLHARVPLMSLYEEERKTFLYNLDRYDQVIIVTDADPLNTAGLDSLIGALEAYGNKEIRLVRWS